MSDQTKPPQPALRRLLIGRAFPPQIGGRLPIECYVDIRIVGDADAAMFEPFTRAVLEAFNTRVDELGWCDEPGGYSRQRVQMDGDVEVVEYLGKNALGQVLALSQMAGRSFLTLGEPPQQREGQDELAVAFAGVLPTWTARKIHELIRDELGRRGHKFATLENEGANGQEKAIRKVDDSAEHGRGDRPDSEPPTPNDA